MGKEKDGGRGGTDRMGPGRVKKARKPRRRAGGVGGGVTEECGPRGQGRLPHWAGQAGQGRQDRAAPGLVEATLQDRAPRHDTHVLRR